MEQDNTQPQPFISWYKQCRGDDLGRPVMQHPPLNKGVHAQAGLPKSFVETDSGMAPRVQVPVQVNRVHTLLMTSDIEGAQSRPRDQPARPRDTHPCNPIYKLASSNISQQQNSNNLSSSSNQQLAGSAVTDNSCKQLSQQARKESNNVADISGAVAKPLPAYQPQLQNLCLDISDIAGTTASVQQHSRSMNSGALADNRLDVSDINAKHKSHPQPRRADEPWPTEYDTIIGQPQTVSAQAGDHRRQSHVMAGQAGRRAQRPASAQPTVHRGGDAATAAQQLQYTGLPYFQLPRGPQDMCLQPPTAAIQPPPTAQEDVAVHDLVQEQQQSITHMNTALARAKRQQQLLNNNLAHTLRVDVSKQVLAARRAAATTIDQLKVSRSEVGALWDALRKSDREASGKVTVQELGASFREAGVQVPSEQLQSLVYGLEDGVGLIAYADLTKTLLVRSRQQARPHTAACVSSFHGRVPAGKPTGQSGGTAWDAIQGIPPEPAVKAVQGVLQPPVPAVLVQGVAGPQPQQVVSGQGAAGARVAPPDQEPFFQFEAFEPNKDASKQRPRTSSKPTSQIPTARVTANDMEGRYHSVDAAAAGATEGGGHTLSTIGPDAVTECIPQQASIAGSVCGGADGSVSSHAALPPGAVVCGPEGARYYTYKGKTFWFAGNDTQQELTAAAAAYKATTDLAHSIDRRYASKGLGDGGPLTSAVIAGSKLNTQGGRPRPASAGMVPAPNSGKSLGCNLRAVVGGGQGTGASIVGMENLPGYIAPTHAGHKQSTRPRTAKHTPAWPATSSFTSVANTGAGRLMSRHADALLRDEVHMVRLLS